MTDQHDARELRSGYKELGLGEVEAVDSWIETEVAGGGRYLAACALANCLRHQIGREWARMRAQLERSGVVFSDDVNIAMDRAFLGVLSSVASVLSQPEAYIPESVQATVKGWVLLEEVGDGRFVSDAYEGWMLPPLQEVVGDCQPGGANAPDPEAAKMHQRVLDGIQQLIDQVKRRGTRRQD
jgi:hypothetical protein